MVVLDDGEGSTTCTANNNGKAKRYERDVEMIKQPREIERTEIGQEVTFLTSEEIPLHEVKNRFEFGRRR